MSDYIFDQFTEAADTALAAHTPSPTANGTGWAMSMSGSGFTGAATVGSALGDVFSTATAYSYHSVGGTQGTGDIDVSADIIFRGTVASSQVGIVARGASNSFYWFFYDQVNTYWGLYRVSAGSGAFLGSTSSTPTFGTAVNTSHTMKMSIRGAVVTCYVDGTQVIQATDSSPLTNAPVGIGFGMAGSGAHSPGSATTGYHIDNFHAALPVSNGISANLSTIDAGNNGTIAITLTGTGTAWTAGTPGSPTFTVSGVTGVSISSQSVASATSATIHVSTGSPASPSSTGALTVSDGTYSTTIMVGTPALAISPTSGGTGTMPTLTLTGTDTTWQHDDTAPTLSVTGGTGASIGSPTFTSDTAGTAVLTVGTAAGTLTVKDNSTGKAATFTATGSPVTVPVTDANWFWSPYGWYSDGAGALGSNNIKGSSTFALTNTPGNYFKVGFSGTSCTLNFDFSPLSNAAPGGGKGAVATANYPFLLYSVDGGAWTSAQLGGGTGSTAGMVVATGLAAGNHTLHCYVLELEDNNSSYDKWLLPGYVVKITSLTLDSGAATVAPSGVIALGAKRAFVLGDSIVEGRLTTRSSEDATQTLLPPLLAALDAEYGVAAFNAQGYSGAGYSNVPKLIDTVTPANSTWNQHYSGATRLVSSLFSPVPDYIFNFHGRNTVAQADVTATITALVGASGAGTKVFVSGTFDGLNAATVASGFNAQSASNAYLLDYSTIHSGAYPMHDNAADSADNIHPDAKTHARLAAETMKMVQSALTPRYATRAVPRS